MQRRRFEKVLSFPDSSTEADRLRAEVEKLPPGPQRHDLERKRVRPRPRRISTSG
jgi:hypothetical protein